MKQRSFTAFWLVLLSVMTSIVFAGTVPDGVCPELTTLQQWAGYVSWLGFFKLVGVAAIAGGLFALFGGLIKKLLYNARVLLEALAYVASGVLLASHWLIPAEFHGWTVMLGSLLFAGTMAATVMIHKIKVDPKSLTTILMVLWGAVAIFYNMSEVGFLAVLALMSLMGFTAVVGRMHYAFGFHSEQAVVSGTTSALFVLAAFIIVKLFVPEAPDFVKVFQAGAFWAGSFVGFLGLLILSNRYYIGNGGSYLQMQFVTNAILLVCVFVGMTYGINALAGMAGTFFVLYWAEKPLEIEIVDSMVTFGLVLLMTGGILFGAWYWAQQNMDLVQQYLTTAI